MEFGMYTDSGNQVIGALVEIAKKNKSTIDQAYKMLESISEIPGLEEATDTEVIEIFFSTLGYYND